MVLCVSLLRLIRSMYNTYNIFGKAFLFQQWSRQNIDVNVFANERRFVMVVVGLNIPLRMYAALKRMTFSIDYGDKSPIH